MADSSIAITAGTGTTVDTRTEATNGHHRQVVVLGDPATNAGVAPVDATAGLKVDLGSDNDVVVSATNLDVRDLTATDVVTVTGGAGQTADVKVTLDSESVAVTNAGITTIAGAVSGTEVQVDVLTMPTTTVQATNLDIRDLTSASDSVAAAQSGTWNITNVSGTVSLPTGASTAAKQPALGTAGTASADVISIQGIASMTPIQVADNGGALTVDGTVAVTNAGITTIAGAVSGTEMQVDVLTMPTTTVQATNLDVRDLAAASDSVTVHGDVGVLDQIDLTNSNPAAVAIVDGNGDQITSFGGGTQYTEGDTDASITGTALMFESNTGTNAVSVVSSSNPLPISDAGGAITVDGSLTVDLGANNDVTLATLPDTAASDLATINSNTDTLAVTGGGTETGALRVTIANNSTGVVSVDDNGGALTVDNGGTFAVQATLAAETTKVIGTVNVAASQTIAVTQATAASLNMTEANSGAIKTAVETIDNAISGSEMQVDVVGALPAGTNAIGKLAANSGVDIGDVDVTSLPALAAGTNAIGKLLPPDVDVTAHTNYARKYYTSTGAATDGIVWSPAAGKRWHVTSLIFQVSADATVTFEDDKAGGDDPVLKGEFKAGSGLALTFDEKYPFASGEDAADLLVTTSAGNIYVSVVGYEI